MDHLDTPLSHRFVASPAGALLDTRGFEALKTRSLPSEFGVARARAAADVSLGSGPEAFLEELGAPPAPNLHARIERALARYAARRADADEAEEAWEDAFWGASSTTPDERVALERTRRHTAARCARPARLFGFLARQHLLPPVKYEVPPVDAAMERWAREIVEPERLYGVSDLPEVRRSRSVAGPGTREYFLRFESPSPYFETASARVYEPLDWQEGGRGDAAPLPTLVFHSGLASMTDRLDYWPEESAVARVLAPRGYRVVLPEAPWHGRREAAGWFSGEPYLARAPVGLFTLYSAAATETAALVGWARNHGAPVVGVGGLSLGGTVALHVAGRCGSWPVEARPDLVVPVGAPGDIDRTLTETRLAPLLGLDDALAAAGWDEPALREFAPLLNPSVTSDMDPERIYPVIGARDRIAPVITAHELVDSWGVPDRNVTEWDVGHFGVLLRLLRGRTVQETTMARLDALAVAHGTRSEVEKQATA